MTPAQRARQRLLDDFEFYATHSLKIRTKESTIVPFKMNKAQRILHDVAEEQRAKTGRVRIIILKARQMGLSTYVGGRLFWRVSQNEAKRCIVVTHEASATETLFKMTRRYYDRLPEAVKFPTKYLSQRAIDWSTLDSSYTVGTAGSDSVGRGDTITHAHLSEVAFWPSKTSKGIFSGLMDAVPKRDDTEVFIESTACGVSGVFYEQWQTAVRGEGDFIPVFLPWFIDDGYRLEPSEGFTRTPDEQDYADRYDLDDAQLMFRRVKIAEKGRELFMQEYPACAEEAFLTSGRPVFDPFLVRAMQNERPSPIARMAVEFSDPMNPRSAQVVEHPRGEMLVYRPRDATESYFIGADIAQGVNGDFSVAQVMDSERRQVATWRGQIDPDAFAYTLAALGFYYNRALLCPENNSFGLSTCYALSKYINYPNLFTEIVVDKSDPDKETTRLGFNTNVKSKTMIVDKLRADMRKGAVEISDEETLAEMAVFIVNENGKMEAESTNHDDCVIALCLANNIVERRWAPIENFDDYYVSFNED